jgi:hypothetical protein
MDKIEIKITRDCDAEGNGGTIVDHAVAVLGNVASNGPMLDAIVGAFQDAYGLHQVEADGVITPVTGYRNVAYQMRQYMTEITTGYLRKLAIAQAEAAVNQHVSETLSNLTIVDGAE